MKLIGYAVVDENDKLYGIIQHTQSYAAESIERYRKREPSAKLRVACIYVGSEQLVIQNAHKSA